ncbi:AMP-binding protein [Luteipulveratus halotolerans]|uniref:AMP-binding protein n=1 Tax=Luteipulveratus halotolerans TaxID=1631356 RepID=UPI000681D7C0|nr:AMP-binding protein [Luteipulveratus halotolerans]
MLSSVAPQRERARPVWPLAAQPSPDTVALVQGDRSLSHAELHAEVVALAERLPSAQAGRLLAHVPLRPDLTSVISYLAVLYAGHVALVTTCDPHRTTRILERYAPDVVTTGDPAAPFDVADEPPRHLLHPDLAVLLSTSGTTGSAKLVRLSHAAIDANAEAIATALGLRADDRGVTSLPLHYCYGLSVLHAHLRAGGGVVLRDGSVTDPGFWGDLAEHGVTTLAAVPHTLDLLDRSHGLQHAPTSLRLITQAGGRLAPERVEQVAEIGRRRAFGLAVMYGQTEVTARISVLPAAEAVSSPDSVGYPVPGLQVRLDRSVPESDGASGELIVSGDSVMLGYAEHADDLALGPSCTEHATGDLATIDGDGRLRIVGRRSGFAKVMGLRIDVAAVENAVAATGLEVCVTADDDGLRVAVEPAALPDVGRAARVRALVADLTGLGPAAVNVAEVPLARLDNGKLDRQGCDALARGLSFERCDERRRRVDGASTSTAVAKIVGDVLGREDVSLEHSFAEQGGDSLSHVQAATRLETLLGPLPDDWHHRPLGSLSRAGATTPATRRTVETTVLLRAIAAFIICGTHAGLFWVVGGAHTLLVVAGYNAARFGFASPHRGERARRTARLLIGLLVPAAVVALVGLITTGRYGWANVGAVNWIAGDVTYGSRNELWFVDALAACFVAMVLVLSLRPVARLHLRDPWAVYAALLVLALVPRFVILAVADGTIRGLAPTVFWLFAAGAALAAAASTRRRAITVTLTGLGVATFFDDPIRNATVFVGVCVLAYVPSVRLHPLVARAAATLAAASLYIYLTQFQVFPFGPGPVGRVALALLVGVLVWKVADRPVRRLQNLVPLRRTPSAPAHHPLVAKDS